MKIFINSVNVGTVIVKLQILSDLHLEMSPCEIPGLGEIIVLAGDVHSGIAGIEWAKEKFADIPVVYIAGNHEFYGHLFPDLIDDLYIASKGSNVNYLENGVLFKNGIRFLGATLWTDFTLMGNSRRDISIAKAKQGVNDFRGSIKKGSGVLLHPSDVSEVYNRSLSWLKQQLSVNYDGPTIVVTHHAPSLMSSHQLFRYNSLNPAFVCNLEKLIQNYQPEVWISGHTHYCTDYWIGRTHMISNQRGYGEQDGINGFIPDLVVEI